MTYDPHTILDKCVRVYGLTWTAYAHALRAGRHHAQARRVATLTVTTIADTATADKLIRAYNGYDPKHPRRAAPAGFSPLLGLRLALVHLDDHLSDRGVHWRVGTFDGHLYEFHQATARFLAEVSQTVHGTLGDDITAVWFDIPPLPTLTPTLLRRLQRKHKVQAMGDGRGIKTPAGTVQTWKFGRGYQSVVTVDGVRIGFRQYADEASALERGLQWATAFRRSGPPPPDRVIDDCFTQWPTLYRTRLDVFNQLFFTIGNGYEWLRGGLVSTSPDDYLDRDARPHPQPDPPPGPVADTGGLRRLYPISADYANIYKVPDDVTDAWLAVAYEAAVALRDRSHDATNRAHGKAVVTQLRKRFGARLHDQDLRP